MAINETEQWTVDELTNSVAIAEDVLVRSGELPIDRSRAAEVIAARIRALAPPERGGLMGFFALDMTLNEPEADASNELAQLIASSLEGEALDEAVVTAMDLRPYLALVARFPNKSFRYRRGGGLDRDVDVARNAQVVLDRYTAVATKQIRENFSRNVPTDRRQGIVDSELRYSDSQSGLDPLVRLNERTVDEQGQSQTGWESVSGGIYEDSTDVPIFNLGEQEAWRAVAGEEQSWIDEVPAENLRITMESAQDRGGSRLKMMSLTQARQYLDQLTDNQYRDWQRKMYQAGYYDKVGAGFVEGDRFDRATDQAWQLLLLESFKGNQPIMNQLATSYETRKQRLDQRWMETMRNEFLPMADAISLDVIGRRLRPDEYESVRNYIGSLQRTRIQQTRGELMTEDQTGFGFDERDLRRGLEYATGGTISEITPGELEAAERVRRYWENKED